MRVFVSLSLAVVALASLAASAQAPSAPKAQSAPPQVVAQTPPMGWNSWNYYAGKVDDKAIRAAADQLVATGMKDAGYIYVNIDDTWEGERDANGVLHPNAKFPDMKALADYVHSKGLKIGIYSSPGPKTCAATRARWATRSRTRRCMPRGASTISSTTCAASFREVMEKQAPNDKAAQMRLMIDAYGKMDKALKATGRPIVFSLCQYGWDAVWEWGPSVGANLWRTTGDIHAGLGPHLRHPQPAGGPGKILPAPATGTIPTCSKWATASSPWPRTARTFRCGRCWPRRCWPATTCPT